MYKRILFLALILLSFLSDSDLKAQPADSIYSHFGMIFLDSFVVTASRANFNTEEFIDMVRSDSSFFESFDNIRKLNYKAENKLTFVNKKGKQKASYTSTIQQYSDGDCRTMETLEEEINGNYYKRKRKFRYYTARMFDQVFLTHGRVCESKVIEPKNPRGIDKHYAELKKLMFQPGEKVDVPVVGKKMAIFDGKLAKYYNYSITSDLYNNEIDCYIFTAKVKPEYLEHKEGKTVIKDFQTYFDKSNFNVIARNYHMKYYTPLVDFDVTIDVKLKKHRDLYVPEFVKYTGNWSIPMKAREIGEFTIHFYEYR